MPDGKRQSRRLSRSVCPWRKRNRQERKETKKAEKKENRKSVERSRNRIVGNRKNIPTTARRVFRIFGCCGWYLPGDKDLFSKTIQFYDINYQLALNEDKTTIFENYCDFLNYFDSSISVQLSFINQQVDVAEFEKY